MEPATIVSTYEKVAELMSRMVLTARAADWDALIELESSCTTLIATLRTAEPSWPLSEALRERKAALIRQMLADDARIRNLTEPWIAELGSLIDNSVRQRKLEHTYRP